MLIVEGPDGAGKSTLVKLLAAVTDFPVAPRVVSAETKAMTDLMVWTERNVSQGFQRVIFDRHRLISDPIYRFAIMSKQMDANLYSLPWLTRMFAAFHQCMPIVIYCMPPLGTIYRNLENDEDNRAVFQDIDRVYYMYAAKVAHDTSLSRIDMFHYDYTNDSEGEVLEWVKLQLSRRGEAI